MSAEGTLECGGSTPPSFTIYTELPACGTVLIGLLVGMEVVRKRLRQAAALQGASRNHP
jgi:hypothetical protein